MFVRAAAVLAPFRRSDPSPSRHSQSIEIAVTDHDHGTAARAVPAVRPAHGHVLFPPETQAAVAAVAAADVQSSFIPKPKFFGAPSPISFLLVEERRVLSYVVSRRARRRREGDAGRQDECAAEEHGCC